jgi:hypothetical protein
MKRRNASNTVILSLLYKVFQVFIHLQYLTILVSYWFQSLPICNVMQQAVSMAALHSVPDFDCLDHCLFLLPHLHNTYLELHQAINSKMTPTLIVTITQVAAASFCQTNDFPIAAHLGC